MNLLKAIESLSAISGKPDKDKNTAPPNTENSAETRQSPTEEKQNTYPNVMASVLERHEQVSNRIKNRR